MEIILLKDIEKLGDKHDVVVVKNGFGRNYLIPKGLAVIANKTNKAKLEDIKRKEQAQLDKRLDEFKAIADKLKGQTLKIGAKAGTSGKIFGSVTNVQLAQALKEQMDIDVERKHVVLGEDIKMLGTYTASLNLHPEVDASFELEVVKE